MLYIKHIFLYAVHPQTSHYSELQSNRAAQDVFFIQKTPCTLDRCDITTMNVGQHLQKFHGLQRGTLPYARLITHSQKARTMYSKSSQFMLYNNNRMQNQLINETICTACPLHETYIIIQHCYQACNCGFLLQCSQASS